jgi:gliding motility-associated-like protein
MKTSQVRIYLLLTIFYIPFALFATKLERSILPDNLTLDSNSINLFANIQSPTCASLNDGLIFIKPFGGQPDTNGFYTIKWLNFPIVLQDSTSTISGLSEGKYCVEIIDSQGCSKQFCYELENFRTYNLTKTTEDISCHGDSTGLINVTVNLSNGFGQPPYQYNWESTNNFQQNNQSNTTTLSKLKAGIYSLTLTDDDGCTVSLSEEISEPDPISPTLEMTTPIACFGGVGTFSVTNISGGISNFFQYKIDDNPNFLNSSTLSQLSAGQYDITIRETQTGCLWDSSFAILEPPIIALDSLVSVPQTCKDLLDGGIQFKVSGGTLNPGGFYNIDIDNIGSFQTNKIDTIGLKTGTYEIFVTDANGCILVENIEVELLKKLSLDTSIEPVSCFGDETGKILATIITDGIPNTEPFSFDWTGLPSGNFPFNNNNTSFVDNLPAGTYSLIANDIDGCEISDTFQITEPQKLESMTVDFGDASCPLVNDGFAVVNAMGGIPPYQYSWNTNTPPNSPVANQLFAESYTVTITDSKDCSVAHTVQIGAGLPPSIELISIENESCSSPSDGSATVAVSGGNPDYNFLWSTSPPQTDSVAVDLTAGNYEVTVSDQKGCTASLMVEILSDILPEITLLENDTLICFGDSTGQVEVVVNSNALPLSYEWSNNDTLPVINNLAAGIYYLTVTDNKQCKIRDSVFVYEPTLIEAIIPQPELPKCTGDNTFLTVSDASGGNGMPFFFSINGDDNYEIGTSVSIEPNTYLVSIMDAEGCKIDTMITVEERPELTLNIEAQTISLCEEIPLKMFISDPGRIAKEGAVKWEILEGSDGILSCTDCTNPILFPGDDIEYHLIVEVVDTNGCQVSQSVDFNRIQIPDLFTPNGDGVNDFFEIRVCNNLQSFDNELIVFNQWGDVVYETENYSNDWRGDFKGKDLPEASYYFVFKIEVSDRIIERKGRIAILR